MTAKNTKYPDVRAVRKDARREWERQQRRRRSVQEWIGVSLPWWLVVIAVMFFVLSMPHTVAVFDKLTPGYGRVAPLGVEFGLLYAAFRRKQLEGAIPVMVWVLDVLLFIVAIIVNGAGSFEAVVAQTADVQGLSFRQLFASYGDLPATSQVALLLAPISALIIPIGTAVAGEGLASLLLEQKMQGDPLDDAWKKAQSLVEYEALRDAALSLGHTPKSAHRWAEQISNHELSTVVQKDSAVHLSEADSQRTASGQGYKKRMDAKSRVRTYLDDNPNDAQLTVRELAEIIDVGKSTVAPVLSAWRSSNNGHGKQEGETE